MKTLSGLSVLVLTAFLSGCSTTPPSHMTAAVKPEKRLLTGSHIPQEVSGTGSETSAGSAVTVIDHRDLDQRGGDTTAEALRKYPGISISGTR